MLSRPTEQFPEWVPGCLILELDRYRLLAESPPGEEARGLFPQADTEQGMLTRLLTSQNMQPVWRSLSIKCREQAVSFERFADALWLELRLSQQAVYSATQNPAARKESLSDASKKLRQLARLVTRHDDIRIESNHLLAEMIVENLRAKQPMADNINDLLFAGADAWALLLNDQEARRPLNGTDALGAALSISLTDAMERMAERIDAINQIKPEVRQVGKPLPVMIPRLHAFFQNTFGQPLDVMVAEIVNTALDLPAEQLQDRDKVRGYVRSRTGKKTA